MAGIEGTSIELSEAPKQVRKTARLIRKFWQERNIPKLRELRDSSKNVEIVIYHIAQGRIPTSMTLTANILHGSKSKIYAIKS
jgi:hypothetical protein